MSFGTEAWRVPGALDAVVPALREAASALPDVRFLLTTGSAELAPPEMPSNMRVEAYVPQEQALDACAAVVHHCGFNTTMAALARGRPSVALPLFSADQFANAARLDEHGAAVWLRDVDGEALADALRAVLHEPRHTDAAASLVREIEGMPPADDAVAAVLAG